MDKVLSTRVSESVVREVGILARQLHTTKKAVVEGAIRLFAGKVAEDGQFDLLDAAFGAWKRDEAPATTAKRARSAFTQSMTRHHR